jgi:hypothetical protein
MNAEILKITPDMAERILLTNDSNRALNYNRVLLYADALRRGDWKLNGESVKIGTNDRLLDGQHRLKAIIQSGIPMTTLVIKGVDESVFDTIDTGKTRTGGDTLRVMGVENATNIASAIILYKNLLNPKLYGNKVDNTTITTEYIAHDELYQNLHAKAATFYRKCHRTFSPGDYAGFYRYFQSKHLNSVIDSFYDCV